MSASWIALLAAACSAGQGPAEAPLCWSPDGRWLAYVQRERADGLPLRPGWLLDAPGSENQHDSGRRVDRLWAVNPRDGQSLLLDQSEGAITSPSWGPDGTALAYGKLSPAEGGQARFEVIVQDAPERRKVIHTRLFGLDAPALREAVSGAAVAWSPDGRYLAVPLAEPAGVAFLRADRGHVLKVIDGASGVSWAPDGTRAAFYRTGGLDWIDTSFGEPRRLLATADVSGLPAPCWSRDSQSLLVVLRNAPGANPAGLPRAADPRASIVRIELEPGRIAMVRPLLAQPNARGGPLVSASFALDASGNQLFYTTVSEQQATQITWAFLRENAVRTRFNPIDESVPLGCLAMAPEGDRLAIRIGSTGSDGLVGVCDPLTTAFTPLVPDAAVRAAWVARLVSAAETALADQPPRGPDGTPLERVTRLPSPGELGPQSVALARLRHLGRLGRRIVDPASSDDGADQAAQEILAEARVYFAYLDVDLERPRDGFQAAASALENLEIEGEDPDQRLRLMLIRLQVALGLGQRDQVLAAVAYLRSAAGQGVQAVEETPAGAVLRPVSDPSVGWLSLLEREAQAPEAESALPEFVEVGNHDAPQPGLGLDLAPAPAPVVPQIDLPAPPRPPVPQFQRRWRRGFRAWP